MKDKQLGLEAGRHALPPTILTHFKKDKFGLAASRFLPSTSLRFLSPLGHASPSKTFASWVHDSTRQLGGLALGIHQKVASPGFVYFPKQLWKLETYKYFGVDRPTRDCGSGALIWRDFPSWDCCCCCLAEKKYFWWFLCNSMVLIWKTFSGYFYSGFVYFLFYKLIFEIIFNLKFRAFVVTLNHQINILFDIVKIFK